MVTSGKCGCGADLATGDGDGRCQMCRYELMRRCACPVYIRMLPLPR